MKKVVFYIRCSTSDQEPDLQIRDLDTICHSEYEVYKENQSAWAENVSRPIFERLKNEIKKGIISDVFVWDLDRLQRNRLRLKEFFVLCKMNGCKIHSFRQAWLEEMNTITPPFDDIVKDLLINLFGWIAEEESQRRSSRIKLSIKKNEKGVFSYKGNKWGRKSFPKQTVTRVLELYAEGKSIREIAALVTVYDKNKNEKKISKSAVHKLVVENTRKKGR